MTYQPASGNNLAMSRRTLLTALPATGAALTLPETTQARAHDPLVPLYHEWLDARREWRALSNLPGNDYWDDPRSLAAEARENAAEKQMLTLKPTSFEGVGALAALAWVFVCPGTMNPEEFAEEAKSYDCRAVRAIWKACTGLDGYPIV